MIKLESKLSLKQSENNILTGQQSYIDIFQVVYILRWLYGSLYKLGVSDHTVAYRNVHVSTYNLHNLQNLKLTLCFLFLHRSQAVALLFLFEFREGCVFFVTLVAFMAN